MRNLFIGDKVVFLFSLNERFDYIYLRSCLGLEITKGSFLPLVTSLFIAVNTANEAGKPWIPNSKLFNFILL